MSPSRHKRNSPRSIIKIWIDLDNTPHVPFFVPIIRELESRGYLVVLSARDAFQVCELADRKSLQYKKIGRHFGKNKILKLMGLFLRTIQLFPFLLREKPDLALSHGSRSQVLLCNTFRVPTVVVMDYEHSQTIPAAHPRWEIAPEALYGEKLHTENARVKYYRGIKEDVYIPDFVPNPRILEELKLDRNDFVATIRPPADEAHYRNPESDKLLVEVMERICRLKNICIILLPRNHQQEKALRTEHPNWFDNCRMIIPDHAIEALNLLWFSDLVISGGGTMNREAAALGVPVYSIFRGPLGAVDRMLENESKLVIIRSVDEIRKKISLVPRDKNRRPDHQARPALDDIVNHIESIINVECNSK
jgi:predicted glycosyltransferase